MKKLIVLSTMMASLVVTAAVAFGASNFTLPVAWFVNEAAGNFQAGADTWMTLKNTTGSYVTVTLDYYDNGNFLAVATTETVAIPPQGVKDVYTGKPAYTGTNFFGTGFGMGANCDRGSINVRWPNPGGYTKARQMLSGYETIEVFLTNNRISSFGLNFTYSDD